MEFWQLYLLTILPDISGKIGPLPVMGIVMGAMGSIAGVLISGDKDVPERILTGIRSLSRKFIIFGLVSGVAVLACPSKESLYVIMGGYYVTNIEGIDKLPPKVVGAMNKFLDQYEGEKPKAKDQGGKTL